MTAGLFTLVSEIEHTPALIKFDAEFRDAVVQGSCKTAGRARLLPMRQASRLRDNPCAFIASAIC